MRPDLLRIEPDRVAPGEIVRLHFPQESERGVGFVLEEAVGDDWGLRYYLTSAREPEETGDWQWTPAGEDHDWDGLGVIGPGPDLITIPDTAAPGHYRICTANARQNFCAPIDITGPAGDQGPPGGEEEGVVRTDTPAGEAAMEIIVHTDQPDHDEPVFFQLLNRGDVSLFTGEYLFEVERWDGQRWTMIPLAEEAPHSGVIIEPGDVGPRRRWPWWPAEDPAEPGWYRLVQRANYEHPQGRSTDIELVARTRFQVKEQPSPQGVWDPREHVDDTDGAAAVLQHEAAQRWPDLYAGLWIEGGRILIAFTSNAEALVAELRREVPDHHVVEPITAERPLADLLLIQARLAADVNALQDGDPPRGMPEKIRATGGVYDLDIDVREGLVVVSVERMTRQLQQAFTDFYRSEAIALREGLAYFDNN
jgi:hypothetical protein